MLAMVSSMTVPLPGSTSSFFLSMTSRKCLSAFDISLTCVSSVCVERCTSSVVGGGLLEACLLRGLCGECDRPNVLLLVRISEIFSIKSSLKERARRANLVPFRLFLCPDDPPDEPPDDDEVLIDDGGTGGTR